MTGRTRIRAGALALAFAAMVLGASCGGPEGGPVEGPGYGAELPDGWEEGGELEAAALASALEVDVESIWIRDERIEGFRANVNVVGEPVSDDRTAIEYARETREQLLDAGVIESANLDRAISATPIGGIRPSTLGGGDAAEFEIRNLSEVAGKLRQRTVVVVHAGRVHVVTASAPSAAFAEVEPEFDEILESWRWTG